MTTLFISDLHLEPGRPQITRLFTDFLRTEAIDAESLYILGDLFEFWIGDDHHTVLAAEAAAALRALRETGTTVHFMHGNRDFLIGESYAQASGMTLLPQAVKLDLHDVPTLLLHGDSLCVDDIKYQEVRKMLRDLQWQEEFLVRSIDDRLAFAARARDASNTHTESAEMEIMDVNLPEVERIMEQFQVTRLIHGHTHRPAVHEFSLPGGSAERIVLGDWYTQGSVLRVDNNHVELAELPL